MPLQATASSHSSMQSPTGSDQLELVMIIGGGPVGMRAAQALRRRGIAVTVLSDERAEPYNRAKLTPLLGGDLQFGDISLGSAGSGEAQADVILGTRAVRVDPVAREVITADGAVWPYDKLIIATGSHAFVPAIEGRQLPGVYTFRSADDAAALLARSFSARRVAVIGGGLLGLEAAKGMRQRQCEVTVIEHESRLMPRQLDEAGGARLGAQIEALGVHVRTGVAVAEITGTHRVDGLALADGTRVDCDTVIVCTGVRPNVALAKSAGLAFARGIIVNDAMQTSDPNIFAVGECAEHDGQLYGLVGPGYAQAEVAAQAIAGEAAAFEAARPVSKLKVIGAAVFSAGDIERLDVRANVRDHVWQDDESYRRIFLERGKLVGAIAVGDFPQAGRVQDAIERGATVYPWMLYRFRRFGALWPDADLDVADMPDSATLCNCTGVRCGQVRGALLGGCSTIDGVGQETGAGTVCGTCRPLIGEMIDAGGKPEPLPLWKPVLAFSAVALLIALWPIVLGRVPLPDSYRPDALRDWLWRDNIVKQWSGFTLLGITLAAFVIGLRKRIRFMDRLGSFDGWRLVHNGIGLAALAGFFAHTGFDLGSGWNMALALVFLAVIGVGAVAGLATGGDHVLRERKIGTARKPPRRLPTWLHIVALWPLPVLLLFHVLASYAF